MLEENKTPLTLAVMARAEELAPNVGDQYETDRLIRVKNVSGSVFRQYLLYRIGVLAPIVQFGDTSPKSDHNWWLASQLLDLDTKGLENPKAGEENAATDIEDVQSLINQIHSIQSNHPNCDVTATIEPDGSLEVAGWITRGGADCGYVTTVTIIELPNEEEEIPAEKFLDLYLFCSKLSSGHLKRGMIVLENGNGGEYLAITKCKKDSPKFRLYKNTLTADNLQSLQENYNSLCELVGYDPNKENAAIQSNDLQTQIEAIKKQYPHCDIEARVDPDGKLRILSFNARKGSSTSYDDPTVVTIVNCDPPKANECPVAKETQPTQEQLKAIFNHVTNMTAEEAENLGFQYSLMAKTNFPRIELQIVSFSKYGNNKDEWKCTIVHQSPTDPLHEQYSFQSTYDFETTCHRLWWPVKCEEWEVGESLPEFISLPVAEFQEIQSQIKELMDWKNGMTKPQSIPQPEPVQEDTKNAVEFIFPPRPNPAKGTIYCIHYGGEKRYGDTVGEIATILRRKGYEVRSTSARLVLKKPALWEALRIKIELQSRYREIVLEEITFKHVEFPA